MRYTKSILLFVCLVSTQAISQKSFTIQEAISYGLENHINIEKQALETEDASQQVREYKSIGIPNVNGGINYSYYLKTPAQPLDDFITPAVYGVLLQEGVPIMSPGIPEPEAIEFSFFQKNNLSAYIEASALLFDASYLQGLKAARLFKELTKEQENITKEQIAANIARAYLATLIAEENKVIIEKNISNLERMLFETSELYKNGFVEQLDVDRLAFSKENLENELSNLSKVIEVSRTVLKYQMYFPLHEMITLTEDLETLVALVSIENVDLSAEINLKDRAEFEVLNKAIRLDEMDLQRLKKSYLPSLVASARMEESLQRNNLFDSSEAGLLPSASVGLALRVPIYDGGNRSAQTQRTRIRLDKKKIDKSEFSRGVALAAYNAKVSFLNAKSTLVSREKGLDLAERIYNKTQIKFTEGVGSSLEINQAESSLYQSQSAYINALYDLVLAKTELDIAEGKIDNK